jgi:hypothetical protein
MNDGLKERRVAKMSKQSIALKEWAVAVQALKEGDQIFILRKGGIEEETRDFQVKTNFFYLYPTYEHQKKHLLKDSYQSQMDNTLQGWSLEDKHVIITTCAEMVEDIEITDQAQLDRLLPYHIWTESFTEDRLRWKRTSPLHLMLLRVFKLDMPREADIYSEYLGCKSWIQLQGEWEDISKTPVLNDADFAERLSTVKRELNLK